MAATANSLTELLARESVHLHKLESRRDAGEDGMNSQIEGLKEGIRILQKILANPER